LRFVLVWTTKVALSEYSTASFDGLPDPPAARELRLAGEELDSVNWGVRKNAHPARCWELGHMTVRQTPSPQKDFEAEKLLDRIARRYEQLEDELKRLEQRLLKLDHTESEKPFVPRKPR
jgi:hypothetical protein